MNLTKTKETLARLSPIDLVKVALADAKIILPLKKTYYPNSGVWHTFYPVQGLCHICFAGALMARTLKQPKDKYVSSQDDFYKSAAEGLEDEMAILDNFLRGWWLLHNTDKADEYGKDREIDYPDGKQAPKLINLWDNATDGEGRLMFFEKADEAVAFHSQYPQNMKRE